VEKVSIRIKKLSSLAIPPTYGTDGAAGADLYAALEAPVTIPAGGDAKIPTGLAMEIPAGYAGLIFARSGLAAKQGLAPANKVGVVDSDYRGEFLVMLHNHGSENRTVHPGDRIAQLVIVPVLAPVFEETDALSDTDRGSGGFGSTGK